MSQFGDEDRGPLPEFIRLDDAPPEDSRKYLEPLPLFINYNDIPPGEPTWLCDLRPDKMAEYFERAFLEAVRAITTPPTTVSYNRLMELLIREWWRHDPENVPFSGHMKLSQAHPLIREMWEREARNDPAFGGKDES